MKGGLLLLLVLIGVISTQAQCPCTNTSLCEPIKLGPRKELFAFQLDPDLWQDYDWSLVTTLANFGSWDPQMVCVAHSHNARVVFGAGFSVEQLYNQTAITLWIQAQFEQVITRFADGVNVDIEDALDEQDAPALTALVSQLTQYFHERGSYYQVTYDVAWSPNCIDKRCYDYAGLANATDFLIMMDYDMRSQIFGPCVASANSPPDLVVAGLANFTKLGIPTDKLVLGLPWYGYDYPCTSLSTNGVTCQIAEVPFRGVNCSDAAGTEKDYSVIQGLLKNSTNGYQWSSTLQSPWFNYEDPTTKKMHQVWFDDSVSLKIKTGIAKSAKMRGVGMWTGDFVAYKSDPKSAFAFWSAMQNFFAEN